LSSLRVCETTDKTRSGDGPQSLEHPFPCEGTFKMVMLGIGSRMARLMKAW
jgi:hypothetical protein